MQDEQGLSLYRAITRFLYEDSQLPGYSGSNAALQKDATARLRRDPTQLGLGQPAGATFPGSDPPVDSPAAGRQRKWAST